MVLDEAGLEGFTIARRGRPPGHVSRHVVLAGGVAEAIC